MQIYALCDHWLLQQQNLTIQMYLDIISKYDISMLQYRAKNSSKDEIIEQLTILRKAYDGCLIINDYFDLVELCDGVHMGQDDLACVDKDIVRAVEKVRDIIGNDKILGISTHNQGEVLQANELDIDYIGLGAYRNTYTKAISNILGENLDKIAALSIHKVAAIGGIQLDDIFTHIAYNVIGSGLL